ncbi:hypothetical protein ABZ865_29620 [Streptomyces sp. NPDC047085]|uniref:hypothetical protein n=1 Tax=Streptomyces sp. NPDC047085 TaxID=3155140 RepID=UPI00340FD906
MRQVARYTEPDLHGLITARKAELELQAEKLSQQLQEVRDELEELTVAERVARRLVEQLHAETRTTPGGAGQVAGRAVLQRERDTDETGLPVDYQRIMDVVRRAATPVMVKRTRADNRRNYSGKHKAHGLLFLALTDRPLQQARRAPAGRRAGCHR